MHGIYLVWLAKFSGIYSSGDWLYPYLKWGKKHISNHILQITRTALSIRLSGSWTPSRPCPPSPLLPHATLNSDTSPPPPPPPYNRDPHQSLYAALAWSLPHPALSIIYLFCQSDKDICTVFVLFNWFALYLPCTLCHFTLSFIVYLFLFFCNVLFCIPV